ncbi:hypothetical protein BDZ89DRAFT_202990 [Hymenopellis radicata]|nr:hypothetical protein BDZ89DRAFT_202990 [Hymenopellis radicata]
MISFVGIESLISTYQKFPWIKLRDMYTEGLSKTPSNELRGQLLGRLLTAAIERHDSVVISWCQTQSKPILEGLQKVEVNELDWLMTLVKSMPDGTHYLRSSLIPRLQTARPSDFGFWSAFVTRLHDLSQSQLKSSGWKVAEHPDLIKSCFGSLANNMKIYEFKDQELQYGRCGYSMPDIADVDVVTSLFELGIRMGAVQACMPVLQRFWDGREKQREPTPHYSALVVKFESLVRDKPDVRRYLQPFFKQAADILLSAYASQSSACSVVLHLLDDGITVLTAFYTEDRVKQLGKIDLNSPTSL